MAGSWVKISLKHLLFIIVIIICIILLLVNIISNSHSGNGKMV